jgi:hypothetical protein
MGPENAQAVKAKLTELRSVITAGPLKHPRKQDQVSYT